MTVPELVAECERRRDAEQTVQLVVPGARLGRTDRVRLFGKLGGPLSIGVACETERGVVAWWDPAKVLAWLRKRGLT